MVFGERCQTTGTKFAVFPALARIETSGATIQFTQEGAGIIGSHQRSFELDLLSSCPTPLLLSETTEVSRAELVGSQWGQGGSGAWHKFRSIACERMHPNTGFSLNETNCHLNWTYFFK